MARATKPEPVRDVQVDTARRIAPWPAPDRDDVRSALDEALAGESRPVRVSQSDQPPAP